MEGGILAIDQAAGYLSIPKATLYTRQKPASRVRATSRAVGRVGW